MGKISWLMVVFLLALLAIVAPLGVSVARDLGTAELVKIITKDLASMAFSFVVIVLITIASSRLAASRTADSSEVQRVAGILPLGLRKVWNSGPGGRMYVILVGVTAWVAVCFLGIAAYLLIWRPEVFSVFLAQFIVSVTMVATYFGLKWLLDWVFPEEPKAE